MLTRLFSSPFLVLCAALGVVTGFAAEAWLAHRMFISGTIVSMSPVSGGASDSNQPLVMSGTFADCRIRAKHWGRIGYDNAAVLDDAQLSFDLGWPLRLVSIELDAPTLECCVSGSDAGLIMPGSFTLRAVRPRLISTLLMTTIFACAGLAVGLGLSTAFAVVVARFRRRRGQCGRCGYPLAQLPASTTRCPECGSTCQ